MKAVVRMSCLVIVSSYHHGNTEKVANAIAQALGAEVKTPQQVRPDEPGEHDLVGFGAGIDSGRHYTPLLDLADSLPQAEGRRAFIFSPFGAPAALAAKGAIGRITEQNHALLREKLTSRGYTIIGEFSCAGFNTNSFLKLFGGLNRGRPGAEDLGRAREFAEGLIS
jgi:flavodoxin